MLTEEIKPIKRKKSEKDVNFDDLLPNNMKEEKNPHLEDDEILM